MEISVERCAAAVDAAMLATDVADFLVRQGVPFREAHGMVGRLVRAAEDAGVPIDSLPRATFVEVSATFADVQLDQLFDAHTSLAARSGVGGTAPEAVRAQIEQLRAQL